MTTSATSVRGGIPSIIRNDKGLYEGNLVTYFQTVFYNSQNAQHPYHNFRHMTHVLWLCYSACEFYAGNESKLTPRQMRNILIAALFHDFNHSGVLGNDDLNIEQALQGLKKYILPEDADHYDDIATLIKATRFPYTVPHNEVSLSGWILRDADLSQAFNVAWLQQVIFGLAEEWNLKPIDMLRKQTAFINSIKYHTEWAQEELEGHRDAKITETNELLDLLELTPSTASAA